MSNMLRTNPREIARAVANHRYEATDAGIYLSGSRVFIGGALKVRDFRDNSMESFAIDKNLLTTQGLVHALNVLMPPTGGYAQLVNWYFAPYSGNYTPTDALTAANFTTTATELTAYTAGTRLLLEVANAAVTASTGNVGDEAIMTLSSGGPYNVYGVGILSASSKSATTGVCLAGIRFTNPKIGMEAGERLGLEYALTAADA